MSLSYFEYHQRQMAMKDFGEEGQKRLSASHLLIIGMGGLGHPAVTALALTGIGKITIVDHDIVDGSNLHRQFLFSMEDIGLPKAQVVQREILKKNNFIEIKAIDQKFNFKNGLKLINDVDLVLDCTDNFESKFLIHDLCQIKKKKLIQASIHQEEGHIFYFDFLEEGPCMRCLYPEIVENDCVKNCAMAGVFSYVPMILGNIQGAFAVQSLLSQLKNRSGEQWIFNAKQFESFSLQITKNDNCPFCLGKISLDTLSSFYQNPFFIDCEEANTNSSQYVWVDIRSEEEIKNDKRGKLSDRDIVYLYQEKDLLNHLKQDQIYLFFCESGIRSKKLLSQLLEKNLNNVRGLKYGLKEFSKKIKSMI